MRSILVPADEKVLALSSEESAFNTLTDTEAFAHSSEQFLLLVLLDDHILVRPGLTVGGGLAPWCAGYEFYQLRHDTSLLHELTHLETVAISYVQLTLTIDAFLVLVKGGVNDTMLGDRLKPNATVRLVLRLDGAGVHRTKKNWGRPEKLQYAGFNKSADLLASIFQGICRRRTTQRTSHPPGESEELLRSHGELPVTTRRADAEVPLPVPPHEPRQCRREPLRCQRELEQPDDWRALLQRELEQPDG